MDLYDFDTLMFPINWQMIKRDAWGTKAIAEANVTWECWLSRDWLTEAGRKMRRKIRAIKNPGVRRLMWKILLWEFLH